MNITVRYFAAIKDITGIDSEVINIAESEDIKKLKSLLYTKYPLAKRYFEHSQTAVNYEYCDSGKLRENDEVSFILPVSGG